jgi:hypothetical protein
MRRVLMLVVGLALVAGCSKDEGPPATTKNLRGRGLKDEKDMADPNAKPAPGVPGGKIPKQ